MDKTAQLEDRKTVGDILTYLELIQNKKKGRITKILEEIKIRAKVDELFKLSNRQLKEAIEITIDHEGLTRLP